MSALAKGLLLAALQIALVAAVGGKFYLDRQNYPRVWVETAPYDPDLPIRGRYVSLALKVAGERAPTPEEHDQLRGRLTVRDGQLLLLEEEGGRHGSRSFRCGEAWCWQLIEPVAFFIPEDVKDPSIRPDDERLWVEVTLPPNGAPRPIRLGVMKDGELKPLSLR